MYTPVVTTDGKPMNAQHDYVIRMTKEELPLASPLCCLRWHQAPPFDAHEMGKLDAAYQGYPHCQEKTPGYPMEGEQSAGAGFTRT
jgi:hypothetical protein